MTERQRITKAFQQLQRKGYATREAFGSSSHEGGIMLFEQNPGLEFAAFYTATPKFDWMGNLVANCGIHWLGDPEVVVNALLEAGLQPHWDGLMSSAITLVAYPRVLAA
jgi:hypothetical protein